MEGEGTDSIVICQYSKSFAQRDVMIMTASKILLQNEFVIIFASWFFFIGLHVYVASEFTACQIHDDLCMFMQVMNEAF